MLYTNEVQQTISKLPEIQTEQQRPENQKASEMTLSGKQLIILCFVDSQQRPVISVSTQ